MDHTENALRAAIKALRDVIAPAIDPADPLANEQVKLVIDQLQFVRERLDRFYDAQRFELNHYLSMARSIAQLKPSCKAGTMATLNDAILFGESERGKIGVSIPELRAATARLSASIRALLREAPDFPDQEREKIDMLVLSASDCMIDFERAWYLPLGFDPEPQTAKDLMTFFKT